MFWRPNTEPPTASRWLLSLLARRGARRFLLDDLQEEFEERVESAGREAACRWYRGQARASFGPMLRARLARADDGAGVGIGWVPAVAVRRDPDLHGAPMRDLRSDLRQAVRTCLSQPMATLLMVVSLGVGIGGATALYTTAQTLLFGDAPVEGMVRFYTSRGTGQSYGDTSGPDYRDIKQQVDAFASTALVRIGVVDAARIGEEPRKRMVELVADDFFRVMGLEPTLGRFPDAEQLRLDGAEPLLVLHHDVWRDEFGSDPDLVGTSLRIDDRPFTIVAIGPPGYSSRLLGLRIDGWLPIGVPGGLHNVTAAGLEDRSEREYLGLATLRPGVGASQAQAQMTVLEKRLRAAHPSDWLAQGDEPRRFTIVADDGSRLPPDGFEVFVVLLGLVGALCGFVLLIACSNAAGVALARGQRRRREMAVRLSLGASRGRLVRMLLIESALPALAAGALGLAVSKVLTGILAQPALPLALPLSLVVEDDLRTWLFVLGLCAVTTLLFGLAPALEGARTDLQSALKGDGADGRRRGMWLRRVLIAGQVALAVIFVVAGAVLVRGSVTLDVGDLGFEVTDLAVMDRNLLRNGSTGEERRDLLLAMQRDIAARPEIAQVELASSMESTILSGEDFEIVTVGDRDASVAVNAVSEGYLAMLGIPIERGLEFSAHPGRADVAVVNRAFVERFWPGQDALGQSFRAQHPERSADRAQVLEVIGVAADGAYLGPGLEGDAYFWRPIDLEEQRWVMVVARGIGGASAAENAAQALREEVDRREGELSLFPPNTYVRLVEAQSAGARLVSRWLSYIGLAGLALALVGIYGLVAFTIGQRRRELAIRQALGATRLEVILGAGKSGLKLAAVGFLAGLPVALGVAKLCADLVPGASIFDPAALAGSAVLVLGAASWASLWPARGVAKESPSIRLRDV